MQKSVYPIIDVVKPDNRGRITIPSSIRDEMPFRKTYEIRFLKSLEGSWMVIIQDLKA